jgi:hypothetical protein
MNQLQHRELKAILVAPCTRVAATRDLPTIAFFRAGVLLRRSVPVPGILATHRPGAIMISLGASSSSEISSQMTESNHELNSYQCYRCPDP